MKTRSKLISSLLVATTLLSGGLLQATTAQASSKTEVIKPTTIKMQKINSKGKATTYKYRTKQHTVKIGKKYTETPKVKGYVADSKILIWRKADGKTGHTTMKYTEYTSKKLNKFKSDKITLFKEISSKQENKNSKLKSAVHYKTTVLEDWSNLKDITYTANGVRGTLIHVKMKNHKGYTLNLKTVRIGIKNGFLEPLDRVSYVKNSNMNSKISKLKVNKSRKSGSIQVTGKVIPSKKGNTFDNKFTNTVAIRDYKGQKDAPIQKDGTFNVVVKNRKAARKVSVAAMYKTAGWKFKNSYIDGVYAPDSTFKSVSVKNVK